MKANSILLFLVSISCTALAQPGTYDKSFGINGKTVTRLSNYDEVNAVALSPGGKIVVAGYANSNDGDFALIQYNQDGTLDNAFGTNGKVITGITNYDVAKAVATLPDGKVLVAGFTAFFNGSLDFAIVRYNANGFPDKTFGKNGKVVTDFGADDKINAIALMPDNSFIVAGCSNPNADEDFALAKYTANGMLDQSFGNKGMVLINFDDYSNDEAVAIAIQADGKVVAAGYSSYNFDTCQDVALCRFNANGTPDNTFGDNGKLLAALPGQTFANTLAIQKDGKIVVGGYQVEDNSDYLLLRFNTDGSPDKTFSMDGIVNGPFNNDYDAQIKSIAMQPDGKIIATGTVYKNNVSGIAVARCNGNGKKDNSFGTGGFVIKRDPFLKDFQNTGMVLQNDGKIVIAGTYAGHFGVVRLLGGKLTVSAPELVTNGIKNETLLTARFYPNPVINQLHIEGLKNAPATLIITDISGNVVMRQNIVAQAYIIDVSKLKQGRYIATIHQNSQTFDFKFIKQ